MDGVTYMYARTRYIMMKCMGNDGEELQIFDTRKDENKAGEMVQKYIDVMEDWERKQDIPL